MEPDRWRQIERLFESALERPESDHAAFLERACAGDDELRREVASLLAQRSAAAQFIEAPAIKMTPAFATADQLATQTVEDAADILDRDNARSSWRRCAVGRPHLSRAGFR